MSLNAQCSSSLALSWLTRLELYTFATTPKQTIIDGSGKKTWLGLTLPTSKNIKTSLDCRVEWSEKDRVTDLYGAIDKSANCS